MHVEPVQGRGRAHPDHRRRAGPGARPSDAWAGTAPCCRPGLSPRPIVRIGWSHPHTQIRRIREGGLFSTARTVTDALLDNRAPDRGPDWGYRITFIADRGTEPTLVGRTQPAIQQAIALRGRFGFTTMRTLVGRNNLGDVEFLRPTNAAPNDIVVRQSLWFIKGTILTATGNVAPMPYTPFSTCRSTLPLGNTPGLRGGTQVRRYRRLLTVTNGGFSHRRCPSRRVVWLVTTSSVVSRQKAGEGTPSHVVNIAPRLAPAARLVPRAYTIRGACQPPYEASRTSPG
jgi:hypothetical protein